MLTSLRFTGKLCRKFSSKTPGLYDFDFETTMNFVDGYDKIKCFRVIDEKGDLVNDDKYVQIPKDKLVKIYETMVLNQEADQIFNMAQRQNRISFYMTSTGEEASSVGTAAALQPQDLIYPQYREVGVFLWRGFTVA